MVNPPPTMGKTEYFGKVLVLRSIMNLLPFQHNPLNSHSKLRKSTARQIFDFAINVSSEVKISSLYVPAAEEVVDVRGGSAELTQTYLVR